MILAPGHLGSDRAQRGSTPGGLPARQPSGARAERAKRAEHRCRRDRVSPLCPVPRHAMRPCERKRARNQRAKPLPQTSLTAPHAFALHTPTHGNRQPIRWGWNQVTYAATWGRSALRLLGDPHRIPVGGPGGLDGLLAITSSTMERVRDQRSDRSAQGRRSIRREGLFRLKPGCLGRIRTSLSVMLAAVSRRGH